MEITTTEVLSVRINLKKNREARQCREKFAVLDFHIHIVARRRLEEADEFFIVSILRPGS